MGLHLFDALARGESARPAAQNLLTRNYRLYAIMWWKPGVSISSGLESVPGRDGQTDGQIAIASTRLALRAVACKNEHQQ